MSKPCCPLSDPERSEKTWDRIRQLSSKRKVQRFIYDLLLLYEEHGLALSHEDCQGGFEIVKLDDTYVDWMLEAHDKTGGKS